MYNTKEMLLKHKEEVKELGRKRRSDAGVKREDYKNILPAKYRSYVSRANSKGIKFELNIDEFNQLLSLQCVFCGSSNSPTIDRINSREGYVEGNVQPCCGKCNPMKWQFSQDDFIKQVLKIAKHLSNGRNI